MEATGVCGGAIDVGDDQKRKEMSIMRVRS